MYSKQVILEVICGFPISQYGYNKQLSTPQMLVNGETLSTLHTNRPHHMTLHRKLMLIPLQSLRRYVMSLQYKKVHTSSSRCLPSRKYFWLGNVCDVDFPSGVN